MPEGRSWLHGGLAVAHVELAPPPARNMDQKTIIGRTAILGRIQAQPQEGAHQAPALRNALADHVIHLAREGRRRVAAQKRREVAHRD